MRTFQYLYALGQRMFSKIDIKMKQKDIFEDLRFLYTLKLVSNLDGYPCGLKNMEFHNNILSTYLKSWVQYILPAGIQQISGLDVWKKELASFSNN